jgi:hypothetical protein
MTVTFPLSGDVLCEDPPPTIAWSPALLNRFKVFVGTDPAFVYQVTSGSTLLRGTTWTMSSSKWAMVCRHATANLYIRVMGKVAGTEAAKLSNVDVIKVK